MWILCPINNNVEFNSRLMTSPLQYTSDDVVVRQRRKSLGSLSMSSSPSGFHATYLRHIDSLREGNVNSVNTSILIYISMAGHYKYN